jgi:hypothetical protein
MRTSQQNPSEDGWACDGRLETGGCRSGITDDDQTRQYDFDLCEQRHGDLNLSRASGELVPAETTVDQDLSESALSGEADPSLVAKAFEQDIFDNLEQQADQVEPLVATTPEQPFTQDLIDDFVQHADQVEPLSMATAPEQPLTQDIIDNFMQEVDQVAIRDEDSDDRSSSRGSQVIGMSRAPPLPPCLSPSLPVPPSLTPPGNRANTPSDTSKAEVDPARKRSRSSSASRIYQVTSAISSSVGRIFRRHTPTPPPQN